MADNVILVSDTTQRIIDVKRMLEVLARDKDQSDRVRYCARKCLQPLNDLIAEGLSAMVEDARAEEPAKS